MDFLKNVVGFAEHHENTSYGFGYTLTFKINNDHTIFSRNAATNDEKIEIKDFLW